MNQVYSDYRANIATMLDQLKVESLKSLADDLCEVWRSQKQFFICGNGGSAANAIHLANDFLYGVDKKNGQGLRVTALTANSSVLTCLANDISYEQIFAQQLAVLGNPGDLLLVLSGSGNSANIVAAVEQAKKMQIKSYGILGFSGGKCLQLVDQALHFPLNDMQVSEDLQTMIGHMLMQELSQRRLRGEV